MKRLILFLVLILILSTVFLVSAGKPDKNPKPEKVVIVHSGGHDNGNNPHEISVSCRAKGHKKELGEKYCGKNKEITQENTEITPGELQENNIENEREEKIIEDINLEGDPKIYLPVTFNIIRDMESIFQLTRKGKH